MRQFTRRLADWLAAAVATAAVASVVQTQINLGELRALGAPVGLAERLRVTLGDLAGFGAVMTGIALTALLLAFGAGHLLARRAPSPWRSAIFALAAVVALWVAFWLMLHVIPMPAIAATRGAVDHALMAATGVVGGLLYARMSAPARGPGHPGRHAALAAVLALVPASLFLVTSPGAAGRLDAVDPASYHVETVARGARAAMVAGLPAGRPHAGHRDGRAPAGHRRRRRIDTDRHR